jgi:hypothetical protein
MSQFHISENYGIIGKFSIVRSMLLVFSQSQNFAWTNFKFAGTRLKFPHQDCLQVHNPEPSFMKLTDSLRKFRRRNYQIQHTALYALTDFQYFAHATHLDKEH